MCEEGRTNAHNELLPLPDSLVAPGFSPNVLGRPLLPRSTHSCNPQDDGVLVLRTVEQIMLLPLFICFVLLAAAVVFFVDDLELLKPLSNLTLASSSEASAEDTCRIPRLIIQLTKDLDGSGSGSSSSSLAIKNHNFKFITFDDAKILLFLQSHYPDTYLKSFLALPATILKIDFFRYLAVWHFGGWYFDVDVEAVKTLDDGKLCRHDSVFPIDTYITNASCIISSEQSYNNRFREFCSSSSYEPKLPFLLGQYAFGASKRHPFLQALVDGIHNNVDGIVAGFDNRSAAGVSPTLDYNYVYKATGPDYVSRIYMEYMQRGNHSTTEDNGSSVFILTKQPTTGLWDRFVELFGKRDRSATYPYRYFGNYALHLNRGSWKAGKGKSARQ